MESEHSDIFRNIPTIAIVADIPLGRIIPERFPQTGHSIPWIFALFHALAVQKEFHIHWITLSKHVSERQKIRLFNQTIHILPLKRLGLSILSGHFLISRKIRKILNEINPDLLHIWGVEQAYAMACRKLNKPKILSYQGALTAYCQCAPPPFYLRVQAFWERRAVRHYSQITCESPWAIQKISELSPFSQFICIEYGTESSFSNIKRELTLKPSCLFAGTISELKGIPYLIEAFSHPELEHVDLFIAGDGCLKKEMEKKSSNNVHWLGAIDREKLQRYLSSSWFLIHPTLGDCCPNIVKEARVCGLPVITTSQGGQIQYVEDGKSGYIIPPRNSNAIRKAVLLLSENQETAQQMGKYGQDDCRDLLNVNKTVDSFMNLYRSILH